MPNWRYIGHQFYRKWHHASQTSQILGLNASATVNGAVYDAMATVPSTPRESYATFTIQVANANNESVTITENDIRPHVHRYYISSTYVPFGMCLYSEASQNHSCCFIYTPNGDTARFCVISNEDVSATVTIREMVLPGLPAVSGFAVYV